MKSAPKKLAMPRCQSARKTLLALTAAVGLLACGAGTARAVNILFNGTLDQIDFTGQQINATPVGWQILATKTISAPIGGFLDGGDSEPWCNVADTNGFGFFFKPFQGTVGPPADLLGVYLYQDNPATPGTKYTLSGYAAGEANYSGFFTTNTPQPATLFVIEFLDNSGTLIASNAFDLIAAGLPNGGPGSMASFQYTTPQVTAPANTATVRAGATILNVYSTGGAQSFFVDAFDLESTAPPGAPVITNQPAQVSVPLGGTATFTVGVSNSAGVTYQWQHANTNIVDGGEYSGTSTAALTVQNVAGADVGHYRVLVSNAAGSVYSDDATLTILNIGIFPVVSLTGKVGDTYRVDYATALAPTAWIPMSTNKLTSSPQQLIDSSFPQDKARFYRAVFLY